MKPDLKAIREYCFENPKAERGWILTYIKELADRNELLERVADAANTLIHEPKTELLKARLCELQMELIALEPK